MSAVDEIQQRMREKLEAGYPVPWIPGENGDTEEIIGTFIRLEQAPTRNFGMQWVMILADLESRVERSVWLLHTVLRNELSKLKPVTGETVAIRHLGKKSPASGIGQDYDDYRVVCDRQPGTVANWDAVGANAAATVESPTQPVRVVRVHAPGARGWLPERRAVLTMASWVPPQALQQGAGHTLETSLSTLIARVRRSSSPRRCRDTPEAQTLSESLGNTELRLAMGRAHVAWAERYAPQLLRERSR